MSETGFSNPVVAAGVLGLTALFARRAVTPVEATAVYLSRVARLDPGLGAVTDMDADTARAAAQASAERWSAGQPRSPLDGVPMLMKSNIAVMGLPLTGGIGAYRDNIASEDADVVRALREAGAVILGTVNMHEGALGATTDNPWFGRTHNPHRHGFTPGGSSGGSGAAVAAGLCAAALGTDTMGSVRIPSGYCGVFGHKPGRGGVSNKGVMPLSSTLDSVGPHGRSARDCAAILAVLSPGLGGTVTDGVLGILDFSGQVDVEPQVLAALQATRDRAHALGFKIEPVRLPNYDFGRMRRLGLLISEAEGFEVHEAALAANPEGFSQGFRELLLWGKAQGAEKLARARVELAEVAAAVIAAFQPYAAVLMPTAPQVAFAFGSTPANQADFTAIGNFTGLPATTFPVGMTTEGLPLSCQVVSTSEATTLALAEQLSLPISSPVDYRG